MAAGFPDVIGDVVLASVLGFCGLKHTLGMNKANTISITSSSESGKKALYHLQLNSCCLFISFFDSFLREKKE